MTTDTKARDIIARGLVDRHSGSDIGVQDFDLKAAEGVLEDLARAGFTVGVEPDMPNRLTSSEESQLRSWAHIAGHPVFAPCINRPRGESLLDAMMGRLTELGRLTIAPNVEQIAEKARAWLRDEETAEEFAEGIHALYGAREGIMVPGSAYVAMTERLEKAEARVRELEAKCRAGLQRQEELHNRVVAAEHEAEKAEDRIKELEEQIASMCSREDLEAKMRRADKAEAERDRWKKVASAHQGYITNLGKERDDWRDKAYAENAANGFLKAALEAEDAASLAGARVQILESTRDEAEEALSVARSEWERASLNVVRARKAIETNKEASRG